MKIFLNHPPAAPAAGHEIPNPPEMIDPRPRVIIHVQSVAKNAGNSMIATKHPFTTPTAIPIKILIRIPTPVGSP